MKKTRNFFNSYIFPMAFIGLLGMGCSTDTTIEMIDQPIVVIVQTGEFSPTECSVILTPDALTDRFEYAIGVEADRVKFANGTLETIQKQAGKEALTVVFDNLQPGEKYTVFARAYTVANYPGAIASCLPQMNQRGYSINQTYVTDQSAGFTLSCSADYYRFRYLLGTAADREAFENGTIEAQEKVERTFFGVNFFDLKANTNYVFYCQGYDRNGAKTAIVEVPITTHKESMSADPGCPGVTMTVSELSIFGGRYTLTPNSLCTIAAVVLCNKGQWDDAINNQINWRGDILAMLTQWYELVPGNFAVFGEGVLEAMFMTPQLLTDFPLEAFVLTFDKDGNPFGVSHFDFQTPAVDPNAGVATATLVVSDITTIGATYTLTANDKTFGYVYNTIEADWWDEFKKTEEWHENYLGDLLFSLGRYWHHTNSGTAFTDKSAKPGTRYYATVVPMNFNGPATGWGEAVQVEYTTLLAEESDLMQTK